MSCEFSELGIYTLPGRINGQFDAGAHGVLFHVSLPNQVSGLLDAYRVVLYTDRFKKSDPWFNASSLGTGIT